LGKSLKIAIDGPAGSGKSTIAKILAEKLSLLYIDTGAMYRAITFKALQSGRFSTKDIIDIAENSQIIFDKGRIYLDGMDVTEEIRKPEIDEKVSFTASIPEVRERLVMLQRKMAAEQGVVMDGRDIGTVVLPDADYKFFLTANIEERAIRRYNELLKKGVFKSFQEVKEEIIRRDKNDAERECSPFKKAEDAVEIDTTDKDINTVVKELMEYIKKG